MDNIFSVNKAEKKALGIINKRDMMSKNILEIFKKAREIDPKKTELTLDEITMAYYNLYTKVEGGSIKVKKNMTQKLYIMRQVDKSIELVPGTRGKYRLTIKKK